MQRFKTKQSIVTILICAAVLFLFPSQVSASAEPLTVTPTFTGSNTAAAYAISSSNTYNLTFDIVATGIEDPILQVTIPKGINLNYYPTSSNAVLSPLLAATNPVTLNTDADGNKVLTYRFKPDATSIGFNITLFPSYKLNEQTYTVNTKYFNGATELKNVDSSITITDNPCFNANTGYFRTNKCSGLLLEGITDYYIPFNCDLYLYDSNHYAFDEVNVIIPISDDCVPGFGQNITHTPFVSGVANNVTIGGVVAYTVTYYDSYSFKNSSNTVVGTGKALVMTLPASNALTSGNYSSAFSGNIYLKYTVSTEKVSSKFLQPQIKAKAGSNEYIVCDYVSYATNSYSSTYYYSVGCEFKEFAISDYLYVSNSSTCSYGYYYYVLPLENNTIYLSNINNNLGDTVKNLKVKYTFNKELYPNKVIFNLTQISTNALPTQATVNYKTYNGGDIIYTQAITFDQKTLELSDVTDSITEMEVVYDKLDRSTNTQELLRAYVVNRDNLTTGVKTISAQILSAESTTYGSITALPSTSYNFNMIKKLEIYGSASVSPTTLNKGDDFNITFYTTSYQALLKNPCFYVVMPKGYIYMGYTPPSGYADGTYSVTTRDLGTNMLYILKYTDDVERYSYYTYHNFKFKVGPSIPTSTVQIVNLPVAFYMENNAAIFPMSTNSSYSYIDVNDYNENGMTDDILYKVYGSTATTINSVSAMTAQSFLTTDIAIGENTNQQYRYNSTGTYKYYMYNGLQVGNDASNLTIDIKVARDGNSLTYNNTGYDSSFDSLLTGSPVLSGEMFDGATITYKLEGAADYVASPAGVWDEVTDIRIVSAAGRSLSNNETAIIEVPFKVSGYTDSTTTGSRAYFDTEMDYKLSSTGATVHIAKIAPSALIPAATNVTGTIYKDYNGNGTMDGTEGSAYRYYTLSLYAGSSATGAVKSSVAVNTSTGRFTLGVLNAGTYTLKVNKNTGEYYPIGTTDFFDDNGCYTFTIGEASADQLTDLNLGMLSPRTVSYNFTSVTLLEGTPRTIVPTPTPVLQSGENSIQFASSDTNVVTVSSNGAITYVGEGSATITVTVPQLAAIKAIEGENADITQNIYVTSQKAGCHITATPYASLNASTSVTSSSIQLSGAAPSTQRFYYMFNRGGYCNTAHANTKPVTWSIVDDGGTGATISSTTTNYYNSGYEYATLTVSSPGTITLKATETWAHDASIKPNDITVTVSVYSLHTVTLPSGTGYTVNAYNSSSPVNHGGNYSFVVTLNEAYNQSAITVKANDVTLTPASGIYTINNIQENKTITVEGVTPNTYSVTLNNNGGIISSGAITSYTYGTGAILPNSTNIKKGGYVFNGWTATNGAGDVNYISSIVANSTGNRAYYAKWTVIPAGGPSSLSVDVPTLTYGYAEGTLTASAIAAEGHTISGYQWYSCDSSGNNETIVAGATSAAFYLPTGLDAGTYHYFCSIESTRNDNNQIISVDTGVSAVTIAQKVLTAQVAALNKKSDATTAAVGTIELEGIISSDIVTASGIFTFVDSTIGTGKTVNVTNIILGGIDAANYSINPTATTTADILRGKAPDDKPKGVDILIDGNTEAAATSNTSTLGSKETTTVVLNDDIVEEKLKKEGNNVVISIPINNSSDVLIGQLNGQTVKNMENKEAVLEIKTSDVTYTIPASQISIDQISAQLGSGTELKDINVKISISVPEANTVKVIEDTADRNSYQLVIEPVEFSITCEKNGVSVEVSKFNGYVERLISIPEGVDPSKITTGVVLNDDGTFSHVPTTIVIVDGKYYAKINSLTNSTYSVIYNPVTFSDVSNHWAKEAVNDMGSRLVVSGVDEDQYAPDRDITRAEFATIVIRALGLKPSVGESKFSDITADDWYCQSVNTAFSYDIIEGYTATKFGPNDKITREQAMVIIARAMTLTGLDASMTDVEMDKLLGGYKDASTAAFYAEAGIAECLKNGVITGVDADSIAPKENITRAEVALIVQRMLQKSALINNL